MFLKSLCGYVISVTQHDNMSIDSNQKTLNWKLRIVDDASKKFSTSRVILDVEQEWVISKELSGVTTKLIN